jgi:hypothetical protein
MFGLGAVKPAKAPASIVPVAGLLVPSTIPATGIMPVTKSGKKYWVLTKRAREAKIVGLQNLGTNQGMHYAMLLNRYQLEPCYRLDGVLSPSAEVKAYAGQHAKAFCGGSAYTDAMWTQVQELLRPTPQRILSTIIPNLKVETGETTPKLRFMTSAKDQLKASDPTTKAVDAGVDDAGGVTPAEPPPPIDYGAEDEGGAEEEAGFPWLLLVGGAVLVVGGYFIVKKVMK